ncbi:hypothetical protein [Paucimonas lemoignei]|nr:hypothetical protein [Paucimonas lemoignei]
MSPIAEQDYFWMNTPYPSETALAHYNAIFAKWTSCKGSEYGWTSFGDLSGNESKFIHRQIKYWVNARNNQAVTLQLQYKSQGAVYRNVPDNDRQFVVVLRHKTPNAKAFLKEVGVECGMAPNSSLNTDSQQRAAASRQMLRAG